MGTSSSGKGPGSGVLLVPPWVPDLPPLLGPEDSTPSAGPPLAAPTGRFGPARRSLGLFAHTGAPSDMRRGLGHYIRRGYGGARTATQRMGGTIRTAGTLYGALSSAAAGQPAESGSPFDPSGLAGRSADEILDALVEAVRPVDGTQDAEAARVAIRSALSDLLGRFPQADLLLLSEDERVFAIERYIARDVYNHFHLDVGKTLQGKAPNASAALSRLKDVKDYVEQAVSSRFRALTAASQPLSQRRISDVAREALQQTFEVFEEYVS